MESITQTIIALLAVINPVVCGTILLKIGNGNKLKGNILSGIKAMGVVLIILIIAAIGGQYILKAFGISLDAFKLVGGVILAFLGFQMLGSSKSDPNQDNSKGLDNLIFFAASPGTIVMVITLASVHHTSKYPATVLIGITIAIFITIIIMTLMQFLSSHKKSSGRGIVSKFMGLIIVSMGLQFILDGLKDFFAL